MGIRYGMIPKSNSSMYYEANELDELMDILESDEFDYVDISFINNPVLGISANDNINEHTIYCSEGDMLARFREICESGVKNIVINSSRINLDDIRKDYIPLYKKYKLLVLYINKFEDALETATFLNVDTRADQLTDEEWEEEIKGIEGAKKTPKIKKPNTKTMSPEKSEEEIIELDEEFLTSLLSQLSGDPKLEKLGEGIDIEETYTYCNKEDEIHISLLNTGDVMISDETSDVIVKSHMIAFLIDSIDKFAIL